MRVKLTTAKDGSKEILLSVDDENSVALDADPNVGADSREMIGADPYRSIRPEVEFELSIENLYDALLLFAKEG